jgi:hypothetical protein
VRKHIIRQYAEGENDGRAAQQAPKRQGDHGISENDLQSTVINRRQNKIKPTITSAQHAYIRDENKDDGQKIANRRDDWTPNCQ